jgi:RNA polymerase sigma-70 factor (ECF subfamily)
MREARFTRLYEQHYETVRRYVWRRDPALTDDVVAETFLVAWRRLDEVPEHAAPWLIGVARNVRRNARRSVRRQEAVGARLADAVPPLDEGNAPREAAAVAAALEGLPPRDREVLLLSVWDGLDRASIAAALGCSQANVSVRLHRARRRFARALAAHHRDPNPSLALAQRRR